MSIFGSIVSAIFGHGQQAPQQQAQQASTQPQSQPASTQPAATATLERPAAQPVDVEAVLTEKAKTKGQQLNWRTSIVDLMKLLDLDSSLAARKSLAAELHYDGDTNDSAAMNIWLHRQVMKKLAENGGKVPADLH